MRGCICCGSPNHDLCVSTVVSRAVAEQPELIQSIMDRKMRELIAQDVDAISALLVTGEAKSLPKGLLNDV